MLVHESLFVMLGIFTCRCLDDLTNDTDELFEGRHPEWHRAIVHGCVAELFRKRQNFGKAREHEAMFTKLIEKKLRGATARDEVTPPVFKQNICIQRRRRSGRSGRYSNDRWDRI